MTVWLCTKAYYDGGDGYGCYYSPLFSTKELAEEFKQAIIDQRKTVSSPLTMAWTSYGDNASRLATGKDINIEEVSIEDAFDRSMLNFSNLRMDG